MNYSARLIEIVDLLAPAEQALRETKVALAMEGAETIEGVTFNKVERACRLIAKVTLDLSTEARYLAPPRFDQE